MKIAIFWPKEGFVPELQEKLASLGEVVYTAERKEYPYDELAKLAEGADIIGTGPDAFGGFEKAKEPLMKLIAASPNLKNVCLSTTSFGWIDLEYCKGKVIAVSNVPGYSRESVAEHAIAMLLGLAKRIFVSDRRTQKGKFELVMGRELRGMTLGIIGLGNIGSRIAELALGMGMRVIAYNRSLESQPGIEMKSFGEVLKESDAIVLATTHEPANDKMIAEEQLAQMKDGAMIVNIVDRELVNEQDMAEAIKSGKVDSYAYEAEDLEHTPLAGLENAVGLKSFAYYTKEALDNLKRIFVENIVQAAQGKPQNVVNQ